MSLSRSSLLTPPRKPPTCEHPASPVRSEASTASETDHSSSSSSHGSDSDSPKHDEDASYRQYDATATACIEDSRSRANTALAPRASTKSTSSLSTGRMREAVIQASEHSTNLIMREALKATTVPFALSHVRLVEHENDIMVYQYKKRRPKLPPSGKTPDATTSRVLGITQLHAPMSEVIKIIGHKSALSFVLLNPGLADYNTIHTLTNEPRQYLAVKSIAMNDQWNTAHISRRRDFVVMESQKGFQTQDGRNGWVVCYHSLSYSAAPEPMLGAVRASVYNTGIVAIEASANSEQIDLFTVAEYNLKGQTTDRVNYKAARERVLDTLALLTGTIEQRAATTMELLQSHDFNKIQKLMHLDVCRICVEKIGVVPRRVRTQRCRKCCVSVCDDCSAMWRRGKKEMRLCAECWGETTVLF